MLYESPLAGGPSRAPSKPSGFPSPPKTLRARNTEHSKERLPRQHGLLPLLVHTDAALELQALLGMAGPKLHSAQEP